MEVFEEGRPYTEYIIPTEVANLYGPPIDITDIEEDYAREWFRPVGFWRPRHGYGTGSFGGQTLQIMKDMVVAQGLGIS